MTKFILTVTIAAAALAAGLCFDMPASRASYGDAPWCLVKSGGEDSYWDCEFKTFQECLQARATKAAGSGGRSSADHDLDQSIRFAGAGSLSAFETTEVQQWETVGVREAIQNVGNVVSWHSLDSANGRGIVARQEIISKANSI
jgi:hypothetical protein